MTKPISIVNKKRGDEHTRFICDKCNFRCSKNSEYNRHLNTTKHKVLTIEHKPIEQKAIRNDAHNCACGKKYKHRQSYYRHKIKCTSRDLCRDEIVAQTDVSQTVVVKSGISTEPLILSLITYNNEIFSLLASQHK